MTNTFSNPERSSHCLISLCDILEFSSVEVNLCTSTWKVRVHVSSGVMLHLKRKSHPQMMVIRFIEIRTFVTVCSDYNCLGIHFMLILLNPRLLWCISARSTLMLSFKTNSHICILLLLRMMPSDNAVGIFIYCSCLPDLVCFSLWTLVTHKWFAPREYKKPW